MRLFILHADTPFRMLREGLDFSSPRLHLSLPPLLSYRRVHLLLALWCDYRLDDEAAWQDILAMWQNAEQKLSHLPPHITYSYVLEDARPLLLETEARTRQLWQMGVRVVTPFWRGKNGLGGAFDTTERLSQDGKRVLDTLVFCGMRLDISHANSACATEMLERYPLSCIATHSCFDAVTPHPRNLPDALATYLASQGGVIGLSLVPAHLGTTEDAFFRHLDHASRLGIENCLCLGTDFDGTDTLPLPFSCGVASLASLCEALDTRGYPKEATRGLFFENAARIFPP